MTSLLALLNQAMAEPIGLVIRTDNIEMLRQKLYAERKRDPALRVLSLVASPENPNELWIIKKARMRNGKEPVDD